MKYLYISIATLAIAIGIFYAGVRHEHAIMVAKISDANKRYQDLKQQKQDEIDDITQKLTDSLNDAISVRDAALKRLRNRPDRMSETAKAICKGTSGAELSGPDAEFLTREAARADQQREALKTCYHYADTLQK